MKVNGRLQIAEGGYIDNMGCPYGVDFPPAQEAEIFVLKGHATIEDGLYVYLNGEWKSVGVSSLQTVSGTTMPMYVDPDRDKVLSGTVFPLVYNHIQAKTSTWLGVGSNVGVDAGYIAPYNGTIVGITAQAQNGGSNTTININAYVDSVAHNNLTSLVAIGDNLPIQSYNVNIDIDFNAGDLIQTRGDRVTGVSNMAEVTVCLMVRWRS